MDELFEDIRRKRRERNLYATSQRVGSSCNFPEWLLGAQNSLWCVCLALPVFLGSHPFSYLFLNGTLLYGSVVRGNDLYNVQCQNKQIGNHNVGKILAWWLMMMSHLAGSNSQNPNYPNEWIHSLVVPCVLPLWLPLLAITAGLTSTTITWLRPTSSPTRGGTKWVSIRYRRRVINRLFLSRSLLLLESSSILRSSLARAKLHRPSSHSPAEVRRFDS